MRGVRASLPVLRAVLVAAVGGVIGGIVAVALTAWVVPDDPFLIPLLGFGLLLALVPVGALVAVWLGTELAER